MRPRPFLLLLAGFALALILPAAPAAGEMTVSVNHVEISLDTRDINVTSGTQIVIRTDLTEPQKAGGEGDADIDVALVLVQGVFLDDTRREWLIGFKDEPDKIDDNEYPPDYDRYTLRFLAGPDGYDAEGAYLGEIEFTVTTRNESGGNVSQQQFWVNIDESWSTGGDSEDSGGIQVGIPAPSLAASVASMAVIALRRSRKP
jgi:hypothetical protein